MAAITFTLADISIDYTEQIETIESIANVDIDAFEYIRLDTTTGKWVIGNSTDAANLGGIGAIAAKTVKAGQSLKGIRYGPVNAGKALAALTFDQPIYVNDAAGVLGDAAGTVSKVAARVVPVWGNGGTADKLMLVDLR